MKTWNESNGGHPRRARPAWLGLFFLAGLLCCTLAFGGGAPPGRTGLATPPALDTSAAPVWTDTEVVSTESTETSLAPSLAVDAAGNLHVAWSDYTNYAGSGTDWDIFYKWRNATTGEWSTTEVVSTESSIHSRFPSLATDPAGNVHVAWFDYPEVLVNSSVFYKWRNATTGEWSTSEVISIDGAGYFASPSLAVDAMGNPHVVWTDLADYNGAGPDWDIFYKWRNATTGEWSTTEVVSTESTSTSRRPSLAVDAAGTVHVAWDDITDYNSSGIDEDIFYKWRNATTGEWSATEVVSTESTSHSYSPSLAVGVEGIVHVAWTDRTDYGGAGTDHDIFYKWRNATTGDWSAAEVVSTESTSSSFSPSLAVDAAATIHVAWIDSTDYSGAGTDLDIFYKWRNATTGEWSTTEVVSTESTSTSRRPSLAVDAAGTVHVAWDDTTDYPGSGSDWDIFYKRLAVPPAAPVLQPITPAHSTDGAVALEWGGVPDATAYHVFQDTAPITSRAGLVPVATTTNTSQNLTIDLSNVYYFAVVAEGFLANSTPSNSESVSVVFDLGVPVLSGYTVDTDEGLASRLTWDAVARATIYYVYRDTSPIASTAGLVPVGNTTSTWHDDYAPPGGTYYYAVIAGDVMSNSTPSNNVLLSIPGPPLIPGAAPALVSAVVVATAACMAALLARRKR